MKSKVLSFNEPGRFFTLEHCDGCGQCQRFAPDNVTFDPSDVFCYVYRQPSSEKEMASIRKAKELCPVCAMSEQNVGSQEGMV
jgi:ferredoxin